jgi:A/G-specific adenine glycosylase
MHGNRFTLQLLDWYDENGRDLPWRRDPAPYPVWISEIMAQQTQMDRVVEYHARWMDRFPDLASLARAGEEEVLKLWEGLGYYSRARNIRKAARVIEREHGGEFPSDLRLIRELPGVGDYTAGAVASIAFGLPVPAVDANVLRVFARLDDVAGPMNKGSVKKSIQGRVVSLLPEDRPGDFNQAVMELGALVCSKRPDCAGCPVGNHCLALARNTVAERPVLAPKVAPIRIDMATGVLVRHGKVLVQKRRPDDVWPGLWEFPGGCMEAGESPEQALRREYMEEVELAVRPTEKIAVVRYSYTRYRVTMHCFLCEDDGQGDPVFNAASEGRFVSFGDLSALAFPAGHRRLIELMCSDVRFSFLFD